MIAGLVFWLAAQADWTPPIIPIPKAAVPGGSTIVFPSPTSISATPELKPIGQLLADEVQTAFGVKWKQETEPTGTIRLKIDKSLAPEEYNLIVGSHTTIEGGSYQAVAMGTMSLLQCLKPFGTGLSAPLMAVQDKPTFGYRGLLIDVARKYHSINTLKQCVEMCRFYKVRYLQLHLTDDQAFTFPSSSIPEVAKVNQHGGPGYTKEELEDLVAYADLRGVSIIPEIDLPGHSSALIRAKPDLFKLGDSSTINFASDRAVQAIDTLVGEVCEVFKSSPFFHMGGDEADLSAAAKHPDFLAAFQKEGLGADSQHEIFRRFIGQVDEMVKKHGKQLMVWEGFGRDAKTKFPIPKDVVVMEFESAYYPPNDLVTDGYKIVNAAWTPLYVVNKHVWQPKKVYDWDISRFGKFANLYSTVEWLQASTKGILGAQVCAWEQPEYLEITNLRRLLPTAMERVWSPGAQPNYDLYASRLAKTDALLSRLIEPVQFSASGLKELKEDEFDLPSFAKFADIELSSRAKGEIRYTVDGSKPTATSPVYQSAIHLTKTTTIRAISVAPGASDFESSVTYYLSPPVKANLATGKPVTSSLGTQGPQRPELAVDNNLDLASSWWAGPAPQWLMVDLKDESSIDHIELFPYWDGRRYYQYTIEVSTDGVSWTKIVDRSNNTTPASSTGDDLHFKAVDARYVKVNLLKGSANDSVHLVEIKVWPVGS